MRINKKVVIDIASGRVIEREAYDYKGPLARCDFGIISGPLLAGLSAAGTAAATGAAASAPILTGGALLAPAVTGASLAGATLAPVAAVGTGATFASSIAPALSAVPWLSAISTGGQLLSGISSRMSESAQRQAEAKAIMQQTRMKERQQYAEAADVAAKQRNIGAAAGLDTTSGSPLSQMIDTITTGEKNAQNTYTQGRLLASQRRAEASQAGGFGGYAGAFADALNSKSGSILSQWIQSRFA